MASLPPARADQASAAALRIERPAITLDMSAPLIADDRNREPIAAAPSVPGIYRAFLVWKQKYAHLAICNTYLCHGTCIEFGGGCLVSAQSPVLPRLLETVGQSTSCGGDTATKCH
ncbi:MAG: hypothetical protein JSS83_27490 [Cyanobacteria bacterium SZAS LIN-3]|nr:hypothetical protein [Cyanobacteria bacterium SZAS LIN-3]